MEFNELYQLHLLLFLPLPRVILKRKILEEKKNRKKVAIMKKPGPIRTCRF